MNPEIDFRALFDQFDTFLIGRRTFETMVRAGRGEDARHEDPGFLADSATAGLPGRDGHRRKADETVAAYERTGKDIWLFGGVLS